MEAGARIFCSHCDEYQSARTYRRHKASFFKNGVWLKQASSKIEENPLQSSKSLNDPLEIVSSLYPISIKVNLYIFKSGFHGDP